MILALTLALLAGFGRSVPDAVRPKPHIVLILADDLGLGDVGAYNPASKIPTPHLDRLAAEGMRFTDAHSPSAVCTPTRYGVLTGRYCWRTRLTSGVLDGRSGNLIESARLTLPEALRSAGYRTIGVAKWHLGLGGEDGPDYAGLLSPGPLDHGFGEFFGIPASLDFEPYVYVLGDRAEEPPTERIDKSAHRRQGGGGFWRAGEIAPDFRHVEVLPRFAFEATKRIERARREATEQPFFLYLALSSPHTPWMPTEEFRGASEVGYYGDFVAQTDAVIGAVLATLDRLGIADETLVLLTSDNGSHWPDGDVSRWGHDANLGLRGQKADIFEGGHRVPFLARWPGRVQAGEVRDDLLVLTDLMPTLCALAGVELPDDSAEDGFDLSPALLGADLEAPLRNHAVHHSLNGTFAVRRGRWKLIEGLGSGGFTAPKRAEPEPGGPRGQLYDLVADPAETRNLWLDEPELVAELTALLDEVRASGSSPR